MPAPPARPNHDPRSRTGVTVLGSTPPSTTPEQGRMELTSGGPRSCPNPLICSLPWLLPGTTRHLGPTGAVQGHPSVSLPGPPKINSPWDSVLGTPPSLHTSRCPTPTICSHRCCPRPSREGSGSVSATKHPGQEVTPPGHRGTRSLAGRGPSLRSLVYTVGRPSSGFPECREQ